MKTYLTNKFLEIFGQSDNIRIFFTPGRVNLIGEHTDYNGGHVFPCALTIGTYAVVRFNNSNRIRFYSLNFSKEGIIETEIENMEYNDNNLWANYPKAMIWALESNGYKINKGFDVMYYGTIPNGSGLSSSASIEVVTSYMLKDLFGFDFDNIKIALMARYAENKYIGVNCGIMDQFAVAMGKKGYAIFLDTNTLSYKYVPLRLGDYKIVIMNSNKKRGLNDSKYNERRSECEKALKYLQKVKDIKSLGELSVDEFERIKDVIKDDDNGEILIKRARHAVYENVRTIKALEVLISENELSDADRQIRDVEETKEYKANKEIEGLKRFGQLMNESHKSLKNDYEVTGIELDTLVDSALKCEGVIGARMTGAGFGGCAISLVHKDYVDKFVIKVGEEYERNIGYKADFYVVETGDGACEI